MTARSDFHRLLSGLLVGLLTVGCSVSAAVPPATLAPTPAPTVLVELPEPSLAATAGPSLPTTGVGSVALRDPAALVPSPPSLDRRPPVVAEVPDEPNAPELDPRLVRKGPFAMDLYRRRDFASQATKWYCVPAAMLTMINIMSKGGTDDMATQRSLYRLARERSPKTLTGKGAEPLGWARALEQLGYGGFEVGVHRTRRDAVQAAAAAIRATGRPAGLLVWRGAHSWVMSGFEATRDPAASDDFVVTGVHIQDVWYPLVSSIWGKSVPPDTLIPVGDLKADYLKWRRPTRRYPSMDGQFVTILPVDRD